MIRCEGAFTRSILSADAVTARKKPLRNVSVELELVPIFLVSDTDMEATANQRWTSEATRESLHHLCGDCITMTSQSVQWYISDDY